MRFIRKKQPHLIRNQIAEQNTVRIMRLLCLLLKRLIEIRTFSEITLYVYKPVVFKKYKQILLYRIIPAFLNEKNVVPSVLVERIYGYRCSENVFNLLSGHIYPQQINTILLYIVSLGNINPVYASG